MCTETFVSCSVLLRRPKNPRQAKKEAMRRRQARQTAEQQRQDDDDDDEEEEDDTEAEGGDDAAARQQEEMQQQQQQACVKCGKRQGWSIPSKGGWELVALPAGSDSWSASTLLEEQARDRAHEFRCGRWGLG